MPTTKSFSSNLPYGKAYIKEREAIGNCCSPDEFHKRILSLSLPFDLCSIKEGKSILNGFKEEIKAIQKTYDEIWNGNNYVGTWDEDLISDLEEKLRELDFESDLYWIRLEG